MRKKIFIYVFISSVIAVFLTGSIAFFVMRTSIVEETKLNAGVIANMVINNGVEKSQNLDLKAKTLGHSDGSNIPYRITFIDAGGDVVGDSDADIYMMENHAYRAEIIEAREAGMGSSRRYSATLKTNMLYVAVLEAKSNIVVRIALPLTELRRMTYNLLVGILISVIAGGFVSLIASLYFASNLSKPIQTLTLAANELANGNMDSRVSLKTDTEIDELARDFNNMADSLKKLLSELRHKNQEFDSVLSSMEDGLIAVDIEENILYLNPTSKKIFGISDNECDGDIKLADIIYQKPILESLRQCFGNESSKVIEKKIGQDEALEYKLTISPMFYKDKLAGAIILFADITRVNELEKLRSDFVANVSHELRTPLTSIKGYSEALRDRGFEDAENANRFLQIIEIESDRLNVLINDLMELSKIENKLVDANISSHRFTNIVGDTIKLVHHSAKKKNIDIDIYVQDDLMINANKDRMKQLLLNLIDNGIKYNHDGGKIWVKAYCEDGMINIVVKDNGEGIDCEDIPRLFERFYRVEKSRSKELGGTGLGLSIVKHIAELYGGGVTAYSEKGKGSEFIVKLPIM